MNKNLFCLTFLLIFLCSPAFGQGSRLGISPVRVFISGQPGTTAGQEVWVFNKGNGTFLFECEFSDYWYEMNEIKSAPIGTFQERQAAAWIQCNPNRFLVPGNRRQKIKVTAAIPKGLEGDHFAAFNAKMLPPDNIKDEGNTKLNLAARIVAPVVVTVLGTQKPKAEIFDAKISPKKRFQVFTAKVKNLGNVHLAGEGSLVLENNSATISSKTNIVLPFTFPGMTRNIEATIIEKIPPGKYQAVLTIAPSQRSGGTSLVSDFPVDVK
ncbi:MAG: hypothetical protein H7A32_02035 [Deltaproteobacteria bacterium]|nr:hypothetical protein [Deltaproteobacteria bacterium]